MKRNIDLNRPKFLIGVVCLSALLVEGTGLAQQVQRSQNVRPARTVRPQPPRVTSAGRGAFVSRPVNTTDELLQVLGTDSKARQRYAKHFGIPENKVVDFVKNALRISRLENPRIVHNYYVTKAGRIKFHRERLPRGTKVWATRSGLPILKWICANPLTRRLPGQVLSENPRRAARMADTVGANTTPRTAGMRGAVVMPEVPDSIGMELPEGSLASTTAYAQAPAGLSGVSAPVPISLSGIGAPGGMPLGFGTSTLIATPFLLPFIRNNAGGNGNGGGPIAIPEPGTLALLGASLPLILVLHRRRRSRAH